MNTDEKQNPSPVAPRLLHKPVAVPQGGMSPAHLIPKQCQSRLTSGFYGSGAQFPGRGPFYFVVSIRVYPSRIAGYVIKFQSKMPSTDWWRLAVSCAAAQSGFKRRASASTAILKRRPCGSDHLTPQRGVDEHGVSAHFHRLGSMARAPNPASTTTARWPAR